MVIVSSPNSIGPSPRYGDAHIFVALMIIRKFKTISRSDLSDELDVGEGTVRSLLNVLKSWKMTEVSQRGVSLSPFGVKTVDSLPIKFVDIHSDTYVKGNFQQGLLVIGGAASVKNGMEQRDEGIKNGSDGASVFVMKNNRVLFPPNWDLESDDPAFAKTLRDAGLNENDALVIAGSEKQSKSRIAVASIGLRMI